MKRILNIVIAVAASIFLLWKVLKNIFPTIKIERLEYYAPVEVHVYTIYGAKQEMTVADFSQHEEKNIVKFHVLLKETKKDFIKKSLKDYDDETISSFTDDEMEELVDQIEDFYVIKRAAVYETRKGIWLWKRLD